MKGLLYVEDNLAGRPNKTYKLYHFILYPYCGLKWFHEKPVAPDDEKSMNNAGGWIFGGNIALHNTIVEEATRSNMYGVNTLFPFVLVIQNEGITLKIRLATDSESSRENWVDEIKQCASSLKFIDVCGSGTLIPSKKIYHRLLNTDCIRIENMEIAVETMACLSKYIEQNIYKFGVVKKMEFVNCSLKNDHMPYVCSIISCMDPESVSLAENFISCDGMQILADALAQCEHLRAIDLSNNLIGDRGAYSLAYGLQYSTILKALNLSRNKMTERAVKPITLYLCKHSSNLEYINLAYNILGDAAAAIISLLMSNIPSTLTEFDVSFCSIRDAGIRELANAIPGCSTLRKCNLKGCFAESTAMMQLLEAISKHHRTHGRKHWNPHTRRLESYGLYASLGGLFVQGTHLRTLHYKPIRAAFPYVEGNCLLSSAILRRKLVAITSNTFTYEFAKGDEYDPQFSPFGILQTRIQQVFDPTCVDFDAADLKNILLHGSSKGLMKTHAARKMAFEKAIHEDKSIICMRIQFSDYVSNAEEFVAALAGQLFADYRQFRVLSSCCDDGYEDVAPEHQLGFVIFLVQDAGDSIQKMHRYRAMPGGTHRYPVEQTQRLMQYTASRYSDLPSAKDILLAIRSMANKQHAFMRKMGVRTVFLQHACIEVKPQERNTRETKLWHDKDENIKLDDIAFEPASVGYNGWVREAGKSSKGPNGQFMPSMSPTDIPDDDIPAYSDTDDDEDVDQAFWSQLAEENPVSKGLKVGKYKSMVRSTLTGSRGRRTSIELKAFKERVVRKKERKAINERVIQALRALRAMTRIDLNTQKFWEGLSGNKQFKRDVSKVSRYAISKQKLFYSVFRRRQLCDAMIRRDVTGIEESIATLESEAIDGGLTVTLARRLQSDLALLQRDWPVVKSVARTYEYLGTLEEFLLQCARLCYRGPEVNEGLQLRQVLIKNRAKEFPSDIFDQIDLIQKKALLTNYMLSRKYERMQDEYDLIRTLKDEIVMALPEYWMLRRMLQDHSNALRGLQKAIDSDNLESLENAIATASYQGYHSSLLDKAVDKVNKLNARPEIFIRPLLEGVRTCNVKLADQGLSELARIGWKDQVLNPSIVMDILNMHSKIIKDEQLRENLIKTAISIRQGNEPNLNEITRLYFRVKASTISRDRSLKQHIDIVANFAKDQDLGKQDEMVQKMLYEQDIDGLQLLLSGKGSGRIVVAPPTVELAKVWFEKLDQVCNEHPLASVGSETIFAGTMEKAARSDTGSKKTYRKRYFELVGVTLSYYTKKDGEKKGAVRVRGGHVRFMDPSECGGRTNVIELQEGRDISLIDNDLLEQARLLVSSSKQEIIENDLDRGIETEDYQLLVETFKEITAENITVDFNLIKQAKEFMNFVDLRKLKLEMRKFLRAVPKGQVDMMVKRTENLQLDPLHALSIVLRRIEEKTDVEIAIYRARGALDNLDDASFKRTFTYLAKFEPKRLSNKEKQALTAIIFMHSSRRVLTAHLFGDPLAYLSRIFRYALNCCSHFYTETEPMQLARLCILLGNRGEVQKDVFQERTNSFGAYIDDKVTFGAVNSTTTSIEKFNDLNVRAQRQNRDIFSLVKVKLSNSKSSKRQVTTELLMSFSLQGLKRPLLRTLSDRTGAGKEILSKINIDESDITRLFDALQVVMGDKSMAVFMVGGAGKNDKKERRPNNLFNDDHGYESEVDLALDIIKIAHKNPILQDELYLHLCKQLRNNPRTSSCLQGWLLFSLYLHFFAPTTQLLPFIQNFIASTYKHYADPLAQAAVQGSEKEKDVNEIPPGVEVIDLTPTMLKIISYCSRLAAAMDQNFVGSQARYKAKENVEENKRRRAHTMAEDESDRFKAAASLTKGNEMPSMVRRDVIEFALNQTPLQFEIFAMNGSVCKTDIKYGELTTPFSLLPIVYHQLTGTHIPNDPKVLRAACNLLNDEDGASVADLTDAFMVSQFRGFALYQAEHIFENEDNLLSVPVQPNEKMIVEWEQDFIWDLLEKKVTTRDARRQLGNLTASDDEMIRLILRRRVSMTTERFCNQFSVFDDMAAERDMLGLNDLWSSWLTSTQIQFLPTDNLRIDLLFAEESRYVNSGLYSSADDIKAFCLGMQLAISWEDVPANEWGEGHENVIEGTDLSVRPMYQYRPGTGARRVGYDSSTGKKPSNSKYGRDTGTERVSGVRRESRVFGEHGSRTTKDLGNSLEDALDEEMRRYYAEKAAKAALDDDYDGRETDSDDDTESDGMDEYDSDASSDDDDDHKVLKEPVAQRDDLTTDELDEIEAKLVMLGVDFDTELFDDVIDRMIQFHRIAIDLSIPTSSPKYRYFIKRAYLEYVKCWPLYGAYLASGRYIPETDKRTTMAQKVEENERDVIISITSNGLYLMDPSSWLLIFQSPLYDIEKVTSRPSLFDDNRHMVTFNINGMNITVETEFTRELQGILEAYALHLLSYGCFPYGSEYSIDSLDWVDIAEPPSAPKAALKSYLRLFPMLPPCPMPPELLRAKEFFLPPRSRREILAQERAEEELMEEKNARLAAELQAEKQQRRIEEKRKDIQRIKDEGDDDDDDDDDEGGKKKKTRKQSLTDKKLKEENEAIIRDKITASVIGINQRIAPRPSGQYRAPPGPVRHGGRVVPNIIEKSKIEDKPVLEQVSKLGLVNIKDLDPVHEWPSVRSTNLQSFYASHPPPKMKKHGDLLEEEPIDEFNMEKRKEADGCWLLAAQTYMEDLHARFQEQNDSVAFLSDALGFQVDTYGSLDTPYRMPRTEAPRNVGGHDKFAPGEGSGFSVKKGISFDKDPSADALERRKGIVSQTIGLKVSKKKVKKTLRKLRTKSLGLSKSTTN